jgi:hypothetical protein
MHGSVVLIAVLLLSALPAGASNAVSLGYSDEGTVIGSSPDDCWGEQVYNHDESFENGYAWQYAGVVPPYWGAFGEGIEASWAVIACVKIWVTTLPGYYFGQTCDVYVWEGGVTGPPGAVLDMVAGVVLGNVPNWPTVGENDVEMHYAIAQDGCTVGYWGNWPGAPCAYFVAADLNGPGGHPWTCIAPGIGYPTGWNDPSMIWEPTQSLGLGAVYSWCSPVEARSWGSIKGLFQ